MAKKKEKYDKIQYKLDINESMMFLIQDLTSDSTAKAISYFHEIALLQQKEIEKTINDVGYYDLVRKSSYGYYPNTKIYFVASTTWKQEIEFNYGKPKVGYSNSQKEWDVWTTTISMPRSSLKFEHEKLKTLLAEAVLIGDAAAANIEDPSIKNAKGKSTIKDLENQTDSTED